MSLLDGFDIVYFKGEPEVGTRSISRSPFLRAL